jgi:hypothetical protein
MKGPKSERLQAILTHLHNEAPVASGAAVLALMKHIFDTVEDGIHETERMFPPVADMAEDHLPEVQRYRHTHHDTLIADNGAFQLRKKAYDSQKRRILGEVILSKIGADGRGLPD